jgi:Flp pilus assembly protein TadG
MRRQSGQTLVIMAVGMVVLLAMTGLVIDGGRAYAQSRTVQVAAEAAAHAATQKLQLAWNGTDFGTLTDSDVTNAATSFAVSNGWGNNPGTFYKSYVYGNMTTQSQTLDSNARGVLVQLSMPQNPSFTRVIGVDTYDTFNRATAMFGSATSANSLPLAVNDDAFVGYNSNEGLQPAGGSGGYGNFNFVSIVPPGCISGDVTCYTNAMQNGASPPIQLGTSYTTNSFDMSTVSAATQGALQARINQRLSETCTSFTMPSPRVVYLPITNGNVGGGSAVFIRFRAFFLSSVSASGFSGCFVKVGASVGGFDPNAVGTVYGGVTVMKLVRSPGNVLPTTVAINSISSPNKASASNCPQVLAGCQTATLSVTTQAGAFCTVVVSDPNPSRAGGLGPKYADGTGVASWSWYVDSTAPPGTWPVKVACSYQALMGRTQTSFLVTT